MFHGLGVKVKIRVFNPGSSRLQIRPITCLYRTSGWMCLAEKEEVESCRSAGIWVTCLVTLGEEWALLEDDKLVDSYSPN